MEWLYIALALILATPFTWVQYLAVMNLKRNRDKLTTPAKVLAYPVLGVGLLSDFLYNVVIGTLVFRELPKELLLTSRLKRHLQESDGWRLMYAHWFCHHFLDPFDPDPDGSHCL